MITLEVIRLYIEKETGIKLSDDKKDRKHVFARTIYYSLSLSHTEESLSKIAKHINRHHSTLIHHLKDYNSFKLARKYYPNVFEKFEVK